MSWGLGAEHTGWCSAVLVFWTPAVLVFQAQHLTDEPYLTFSRGLGQLEDSNGTSLREAGDYRLHLRLHDNTIVNVVGASSGQYRGA